MMINKSLTVFPFLICILMCGCTVSNNSVEETDSVQTTKGEEQIQKDVKNLGFEKETNTYQLVVNEPSAEYGKDCSMQVTFYLSISEDESNSSGFYLNDVQIKSLDILSGYDELNVIEIQSIKYLDNNQRATVFWSYSAKINDEELTRETVSEISLYDE